jgi:hypothetical protein
MPEYYGFKTPYEELPDTFTITLGEESSGIGFIAKQPDGTWNSVTSYSENGVSLQEGHPTKESAAWRVLKAYQGWTKRRLALAQNAVDEFRSTEGKDLK